MREIVDMSETSKIDEIGFFRLLDYLGASEWRMENGGYECECECECQCDKIWRVGQEVPRLV